MLCPLQGKWGVPTSADPEAAQRHLLLHLSLRVGALRQGVYGLGLFLLPELSWAMVRAVKHLGSS